LGHTRVSSGRAGWAGHVNQALSVAHCLSRAQIMSTSMTTHQVQKLVAAAKRWAAFQEGDSLLDQDHDDHLKAEAIAARERLLSIIDELPNS
jgi:hypothetical protein